MDKIEQTVLELMRSLRAKLEKAHNDGPTGEYVGLTAEEAAIAYRLLFGDARRD